MARASKTIWRVSTEDENYAGHKFTFLLAGDTAASVEPRALRLAKNKPGRLLPSEPPSKPFIRTIECIGDLDD